MLLLQPTPLFKYKKHPGRGTGHVTAKAGLGLSVFPALPLDPDEDLKNRASARDGIAVLGMVDIHL